MVLINPIIFKQDTKPITNFPEYSILQWIAIVKHGIKVLYRSVHKPAISAHTVEGGMKMTSVPISLKTNGASGMASTGMAGGSRSELEALQKKMTGLIKQLKEASHDTSPGANERLKLLELAIKACQMQIEQLMNADAQKAAKEAAKKAEESAQPDAANGASSSIGIPGAQIDTHA